MEWKYNLLSTILRKDITKIFAKILLGNISKTKSASGNKCLTFDSFEWLGGTIRDTQRGGN